jgi:hypothetical protein
MATGARSREEPIVAQWELPVNGVVRNIQDLKIPSDALYDSSNVELVDSYVKGRTGLTALDAQLFGATPLGALNFWQSASAGWIIVATTATVWTKEIATGTWTNRNAGLTAAIDDATRIFQFDFGTPSTNRAYICNGKDVFKTWKPGDANASNVSGTPPVFKDACIIGDRIIGITGTHEVRWGEVLTDTSWPQLNARMLTETPSPHVAIRALGSLNGVVYKRDQIVSVDVTGLAGGSAFRVSGVLKVEGPAGPNAVVDANGTHYYMTKSGRIAMFNGVSYKFVADGVWKIIKAEIDQTKPNRVHGVYIKELNQVRFFYKRTGATDTDGLVILNLEQREAGLPYAVFPGRMGKSITASCATEDDSFDTALAFSNNAGAEKTYKISGADDDGVAISSHMQTGLTLPSKLEVARALSLEAFLERAGGYGTMTAKLVSSNVLDNMSGTLSAGSTIDLTAIPVKNPIGFNVRGRFLGLRLEWTSAATVRYRGAILRAAETTG